MKTQEVKIKLSDKYKRDAQGNLMLYPEDVKGTDAEGKEITIHAKGDKIVETVGPTFNVKVSAPEVSDFTPEQISELIGGRVDSLVRAAVREAAKEGQEISEIVLSVADVIGERLEISDELVEAVQNAFKAHLATAGKSEKAQKNNAALMVASVSTLVKTSPVFIQAYSQNLANFAGSLTPEKMAEFSPVLDRSAKRLDKAAQAKPEDVN